MEEALAFSSGIFLSVVLSSFSFFPLCSRSMDGDTVIKALRGQTIWPRQWPPVRGGRGVEGGRGGGGTGPQGKRGQNGALVYRARTLYSITPLFLSLSLSLHTHTHLPSPHTHHFNLALGNEERRRGSSRAHLNRTSLSPRGVLLSHQSWSVEPKAPRRVTHTRLHTHTAKVTHTEQHFTEWRALLKYSCYVDS